MRRVGMVVDAAKERRRCVFSNILSEQMSSTWMFVEEPRDIMDEATNEDKRSRLRLFLEGFPGDDGETVRILRPDEGVLLFSKALELHC